jgi:hypothetical protein
MFVRQFCGSGDDCVKLALHIIEHTVMEHELLVNEVDVAGNNSLYFLEMRARRQARPQPAYPCPRSIRHFFSTTLGVVVHFESATNLRRKKDSSLRSE